MDTEIVTIEFTQDKLTPDQDKLLQKLVIQEGQQDLICILK